MSMYRGHLLGGFASYMIVILLISIYKNSFEHNFPGLVATLAGSLFPDIDIYSQGQKLFLKMLLIGVVICIVLQASLPLMVLLFFSLLPVLMPHRGLFHDALFILFLTIITAGSWIYTLPERAEMIVTIMFFFYVGVLSHLVLDKGMKRTFYK